MKEEGWEMREEIRDSRKNKIQKVLNLYTLSNKLDNHWLYFGMLMDKAYSTIKKIAIYVVQYKKKHSDIYNIIEN